MLFSVQMRKGQVPKHTCHPPQSRSWLKGGRYPSRPVPRPCLTVITEGDRCSGPQRPSDPQALQATLRAGAGSCRLHPMQTPLPLCYRHRDGGEVSSCSRPEPRQWEALARALKPCRKQPPAVPRICLLPDCLPEALRPPLC